MMNLDFVLGFGFFLFCRWFLSVFFFWVEDGVKTGTCVTCVCVLGAVSGHNIAALTAASHFSLGGHSFFLCVKA